jgi:hypothetical protein
LGRVLGVTVIAKLFELRIWIDACGLHLGPRQCRDNSREAERCHRVAEEVLANMGIDPDAPEPEPEPLSDEMLEYLASIDLGDSEDDS